MARVPVRRTPRSFTQEPRPFDTSKVVSPFSQVLGTAVALRDVIDEGLKDEGAQAGAKAVSRDEAGNIEVDEPGFLGRLLPEYSAARENAALAAYLAESEGDIRKKLADLREQNPTDAQAFNQAGMAFARQLRDGAQAGFGPQVFQLATREVNRQSRGIQRTAERVERQRQKGAVLAHINRLENDLMALARTGGTDTEDFRELTDDLKTQWGVLTNNPLFGVSEEEAAVSLQNMNARARLEASSRDVLGAYAREGELAAINRARAIADNMPGLTEPQREEWIRDQAILINERQRAAARQMAQDNAELDRIRAEEASDLEIAISRGEATETDVEKAFREGTISAAKRTQLVLKADRVFADALNEQDQLRLVANALTGDANLSPRDKGHREAADTFWQRAQETELADVSPVEKANVLADFVERTGIVPESEKIRLSGAITSGNTDQKVEAADLIDRLTAANPVVLDQFTPRERQVGGMIASFVAAGTEPALAVEAAEKAVFEAKDPERQERRQAITDEKYFTENREWLAGTLDNRTLSIGEVLEGAAGAFLFNEARVPEVDAKALADFNRTFEHHYLATGDLDTARDLALKDFDRVWGVTQIGAGSEGGGRTMKYAPEVVYQDRTGWIREQFRRELNNLGLKSRRVFLVADEKTAREATGQPSYGLLQRDDDGRLVPVMKDDVRLRFKPDFENSPAGRRAVREREQEMERAQDRREAMAEDSFLGRKLRAEHAERVERSRALRRLTGEDNDTDSR